MRKYDWKQWCIFNNCQQPPRSNRMYFFSSSQALQATCSGLGIMVTHAPFINRELQEHTLTALGTSCPIVDKAYYLIYPTATKDQPKIQQWKDWLISSL